jgi:hypothetical protein
MFLPSTPQPHLVCGIAELSGEAMIFGKSGSRQPSKHTGVMKCTEGSAVWRRRDNDAAGEPAASRRKSGPAGSRGAGRKDTADQNFFFMVAFTTRPIGLPVNGS